MRPTAKRQNRLRAPLNRILATEANVRLLRVLVESPAPATPGTLARRAQLGRTSVYPALRALSETGIIDRLGESAQRLVQLNEGHPLTAAIRALFAAERTAAATVVDRIRDAASAITPLPAAVWVEVDGAGNVIRARLIDRADRVEAAAEQFRRALADLERDTGITIEAAGANRAELERIARRLERASSQERGEHAEWSRTFRTSSAQQLKRVLASLGARDARRRAVLPFLGVLPIA
ncbi:MAG TPA: hypothetical protein VFJ96_09655 [Gemmatimonadaceae bacterium]|nr:hypothetical protein [Gemmatimonadaceae bacterium]